MELHHGQTIERIIRRNGYSITDLARLTSVNRRSVYNWFNQRHLKPEIIYRIGSVIDYDFSTVFPSLYLQEEYNLRQPLVKPQEAVQKDTTPEANDIWKDKYIELLERYNSLLLSYVDRHSNPDRGS